MSIKRRIDESKDRISDGETVVVDAVDLVQILSVYMSLEMVECTHHSCKDLGSHARATADVTTVERAVIA